MTPSGIEPVTFRLAHEGMLYVTIAVLCLVLHLLACW